MKQAPAKINQAFIFEGRNLYEPKLVRDTGFEYLAIGRQVAE